MAGWTVGKGLRSSSCRERGSPPDLLTGSLTSASSVWLPTSVCFFQPSLATYMSEPHNRRSFMRSETLYGWGVARRWGSKQVVPGCWSSEMTFIWLFLSFSGEEYFCRLPLMAEIESTLWSSKVAKLLSISLQEAESLREFTLVVDSHVNSCCCCCPCATVCPCCRAWR